MGKTSAQWRQASASVLDGRLRLRPARFFEGNPYLLSLFSAFELSEFNEVRCVFRSGSQWYRVSLQRVDDACELIAAPCAPPFGLTPREMDVATLIAYGCSNPEIGIRLELSPSTVRTHVERVLSKVGQTSRSAVAALLAELHLTRLPLPGKGEPLPAISPGALAATLLDPSAAGDPSGARFRPLRGRLVLGGAFPGNSLEGLQSRLGAQTAVEEINRAGGVNGRFIDFVSVEYDTDSSSSVLSQLEILEREGVDGLLVGYLIDRSVGEQLVDAAAQLGVPTFHPLTSDFVTKQVFAHPRRYANVFQICGSDDAYGREFLASCQRLKRRDPGRDSYHVVMFSDDQTMSQNNSAWLAYGRELGLDVEIVDLNLSTESWMEAGRRIIGEQPFAAFIGCFHPAHVRAILDVVYTEPSKTILQVPWTPGTADFDAARYEGLMWTTTTGRYQDAFGSGFEDSFREKYGFEQVGMSASLQYDAVTLLGSAWSASNPLDPRSVVGAIHRRVFRGLNGSYFFDSGRNRPLAFGRDTHDGSVSQAFITYQVQDGVSRAVAPKPVATAKFMWPLRGVRT